MNAAATQTSLVSQTDILALSSSLVQSAGVGDATESGTTQSQTSNNNFINDCDGQTLTNGAQVTGGSCNGIVMGAIPSISNMVSTIITNPSSGGVLAPNQDFDVTLQMSGLETGSFTDAATTYYAAPQTLNAQGQIIGHTHVTIQDMNGTLNPQQPLPAQNFVFFKGINDAAVNGQLKATVTGGLPVGSYRVCTMSSASNHQSVLMPIAQRGAQDDCTKFTVADQAQTNNNVISALTTAAQNTAIASDVAASNLNRDMQAIASAATGSTEKVANVFTDIASPVIGSLLKRRTSKNNTRSSNVTLSSQVSRIAAVTTNDNATATTNLSPVGFKVISDGTAQTDSLTTTGAANTTSISSADAAQASDAASLQNIVGTESTTPPTDSTTAVQGDAVQSSQAALIQEIVDAISGQSVASTTTGNTGTASTASQAAALAAQAAEAALAGDSVNASNTRTGTTTTGTTATTAPDLAVTAAQSQEAAIINEIVAELNGQNGATTTTTQAATTTASDLAVAVAQSQEAAIVNEIVGELDGQTGATTTQAAATTAKQVQAATAAREKQLAAEAQQAATTAEQQATPQGTTNADTLATTLGADGATLAAAVGNGLNKAATNGKTAVDNVINNVLTDLAN